MHEIESLHIRLLGPCQADGAGVIDENVYTAEMFDRLFYGGLNLTLISDVDDTRKSLTASSFYLLSCCIDGTR